MQPWICESSRKTSLIFQINRLMARKATKVIRLCVMLQGRARFISFSHSPRIIEKSILKRKPLDCNDLRLQ